METCIRSLLRLSAHLLVEEDGGELIEWAVVAGLIVVATITTVAAFGTKVMAKWTSVNASM